MANIFGFLVFLPISVLVYWFIIPRKWRSLFLFLVSLVLIAFFSIKYACYFLFNIVVVYIGGIFISRQGKNRKLLLQLILLWLIGNLCLFKYINLLLHAISNLSLQFSLMPRIEFPKILLPLGISYITFRLIHYIVEVYRKKAPKSSFVDFALYVLFFPTFLAGPVERFQRFQPQATAQKDIDTSDISSGLFRIVSGLIRKFIIADNLARFIMPVLHSPQNYARAIIILCIYGLAIRIYMDFSGYTDMALGVARLFGYKIMENFNRPFLKNNIALFWRSWHISVYSWIRDYFFFPLFSSRASIYKLYLGIFTSMVVFHLWHGASLGFLILGIYHGAGLIIWQLFREVLKRQSLLKRLLSHKWLDPVSTFFTFSFVSFGFIFFNFEIHNTLGIIKQIF